MNLFNEAVLFPLLNKKKIKLNTAPISQVIMWYHSQAHFCIPRCIPSIFMEEDTLSFFILYIHLHWKRLEIVYGKWCVTDMSYLRYFPPYVTCHKKGTFMFMKQAAIWVHQCHHYSKNYNIGLNSNNGDAWHDVFRLFIDHAIYISI